MTRLLPLIEYYEYSDTGFVRAGTILTEMQDYNVYLKEHEEKGIIEVQWTQHPKIKLTQYGYETLKLLYNEFIKN